MQLNLNVAKLAGPGRPALQLTADYVRDLEPADIEMLAVAPPVSVPPPIKRITDRHHALARLLAAGTPEGEAALILGYDNSRVSILKNSPAFIELVAFYRSKVDQEFATVLDHMAGLSRDALLALRDRLEENEAKFSTADLVKIATEFTDRTVGRELDTAKMPTLIELVAPTFDAPSNAAATTSEGEEA